MQASSRVSISLLYGALYVALLAVTVPVAAASARTAETYTTDFGTLYRDTRAFDADVLALRQQLSSVSRLRGFARRDARSLAEVLEVVADLRERSGKMYLYGILRRNVDTASTETLRIYDVGTALEAEVQAATAFLKDDIKSVGSGRALAWLAREPRLRPFSVRLHQSFRNQEHDLDAQGEAHLSIMDRMNRLSPDMYNALIGRDLGWPVVEIAAGATKIDFASFQRFRTTGSEADRKAATEAFAGRLSELAEPFGLLYTRRVENDLAMAKLNGFASGAAAFWKLGENIPIGTQRVVIQTARRHRGLLQRYAHRRSAYMNSPRTELEHLYANLPLAREEYPVALAFEIAFSAYAPLGEDYVAGLRRLAREPLFHLAPSASKSSEWGIVPGIGRSRPYLRMNYQGALSNARNLVGGLASLQKFSSRPADVRFDNVHDSAVGGSLYAGSMLFYEEAVRRTADPRQKQGLLLADAGAMWRSFFEVAIQMELDAQVEERISRGNPPNGSEISQLYLALLRDYYGPEIAIPEYAGTGWMLNLVPFLNYAHHNWPAAQSAAAAVLERIRTGDRSVRRVLVSEVNSSQTSDRYYDILKEVGIDLASAEPYEATARRFERLLDQYDSLAARAAN